MNETTGRLSSWWHRLRHADCAVCGREFRKGKGGGVSSQIVCSNTCWGQALRNWIEGP